MPRKTPITGIFFYNDRVEFLKILYVNLYLKSVTIVKIAVVTTNLFKPNFSNDFIL